MNTQKIIDIATNNQVLSQSEKELNVLVTQYPQVSLFQKLKAKLYQLNSEPEYQTQLKKTAIFSPDRKKLYQYLIQPQITDKIEKVEKELSIVSTQEIDPITSKQEKQFVAPSPLEKYTNEEKKTVTEEDLARQQLEKEILQHAISSSILLDADKSVIETASEQDVVTDNTIESVPGYNELGLLDWLKLGDSKKEEQRPTELIDTFIKKETSRISPVEEKKTRVIIDRPKHEFFSPENMAKMSLMEDEDLVTETLAKIYASQGNISKARKTYEKLSLKFPEKSDYFARLKKELDNKQ